MDDIKQLKIAILLPCHNEAITIAHVINGFRLAIPNSLIYVYDNNSTDNTKDVAQKAGAIVRSVYRQGKGHVVRAMFADIDADVYVLADGDLTYDSSIAPQLIKKLIHEHLDMVVGVRSENKAAFRLGHQWGNKIFNRIISILFDRHYTDVLSGFRVFSYRFVKSFPILSRGFDIEIEMTIHSLELHLPISEAPIIYSPRIENSFSKLSTYRDGFKILLRILLMTKETKPFLFFSFNAILLALLSIKLSVPLIITYFTTHTVPKIPTAILTTGIMLLAFLSFGYCLANIFLMQSSIEKSEKIYFSMG